MTDPNQPPNPFSREGSRPADDVGGGAGDPARPVPGSAPSADPAAGPGSATSWPGYPTSAASAGPAGPSDPYAAQPYPGQPYGTPAGYDPYAAPTPPPGYDPQPTPPYGAPSAGYPAAGYGAANPYEVNPYQPAYGAVSPYGQVPLQHPQAVAALVTGILGLVVCPPVGVAGLVLGHKVRKAVDSDPARWTGRGMGTAGFVLGILSVAYFVVLVLLIILSASGNLS